MRAPPKLRPNPSRHSLGNSDPGHAVGNRKDGRNRRVHILRPHFTCQGTAGWLNGWIFGRRFRNACQRSSSSRKPGQKPGSLPGHRDPSQPGTEALGRSTIRLAALFYGVAGRKGSRYFANDLAFSATNAGIPCLIQGLVTQPGRMA